jgi:hypothetical protein
MLSLRAFLFWGMGYIPVGGSSVVKVLFWGIVCILVGEFLFREGLIFLKMVFIPVSEFSVVKVCF